MRIDLYVQYADDVRGDRDRQRQDPSNVGQETGNTGLGNLPGDKRWIADQPCPRFGYYP
jgi:hypothetical protein